MRYPVQARQSRPEPQRPRRWLWLLQRLTAELRTRLRGAAAAGVPQQQALPGLWQACSPKLEPQGLSQSA